MLRVNKQINRPNIASVQKNNVRLRAIAAHGKAISRIRNNINWVNVPSKKPSLDNQSQKEVGYEIPNTTGNAVASSETANTESGAILERDGRISINGVMAYNVKCWTVTQRKRWV
jgi:hypothetical protein